MRDVGEADTGVARGEELAAFRRAGHALVDGVAEHLAALPSGPVGSRCPTTSRERLLDLPLPERRPRSTTSSRPRCATSCPTPMGNGHPAFFGWVNPPPSLAGVVASLAAAAMNPSVVSGDHADVHLERAVVRWLAELVGFPHEPGAGLLTSGASAATIVCLAGARSRALTAVGHDVRRDGLAGAPQLVAYVPAEAHSCVRRALELLGLGSASMRDVPLDGRPPRRGRAARGDRRGSRERRRARAAGRVGRHRQHRRDRPARRARGRRGRRGPLVPRRRRLRRVRGARPRDRAALRRPGAGRLAGARPAQVARRPGRRGLRARPSRRRPARRVQPHPSVPAPGRRRGARHLRRVRPRADAAVPRAQDVGDDRRARTRRHRRAGGPRERARPRAGGDGRARARARARRGARDLDRRLPRAPGGLPARPPRGASIAPCPRRSRRAGGPSSRGPSSAAARRCAPASSTRTPGRSTSSCSWPRSSRRLAPWRRARRARARGAAPTPTSSTGTSSSRSTNST